MKENFTCEKCSQASLSDRTGAKFSIIREWQHRNIVLNSVYTYMGDKKGELDKANITHRHFMFTNESASEASRLLDAYFEGATLKNVRRLGSRVI